MRIGYESNMSSGFSFHLLSLLLFKYRVHPSFLLQSIFLSVCVTKKAHPCVYFEADQSWGLFVSMPREEILALFE